MSQSENVCRRRRVLLAATLASCLVGSVHAQDDYPTRPLRLIAPIAPGGLTDTLARMLAEGLSKRLSQQVVVDNRPGGGGIIGMTTAANMPADGYGLVMVYQGVASVNPVLHEELAYNTLRDFTPVARVATFPMVLVVGSQVPATTPREFLALAGSKPGALSYASAGNATTSHLTMELFKRQTGLDIVHVPYKGEAPALQDLMGGQVDVAFTTLASVLPHIDGGRVRVLGITSLARSPLAPDVPTLSEAGVQGFEALGWYGVLAPKGTPQSIVDRLGRELLAVVDEPGARARMAAQSLTPAGASPAELHRWIEQDTERWRKVIAEAGIKAH